MRIYLFLISLLFLPHFLCAKNMFRKVKTVKQNKNFKATQLKDSVEDVSFDGMQIARVPNKVGAVQIPENIGIVKDSYRAPGDKLVVHIQDAHCNYEAQTNISKMIKHLVEHNDLKLLCVEGSEGLIDVSAFASVPYENVKLEVAEFFMKKGRITGPEYYAVVSGKDVELFGIEDTPDYNKNLNAFKKTMPYRPRFESAIAKIKNVFEDLKPKIYNRHLILMDTKEKLYDEHELTFSKYAQFLVKMAKKSGLDFAKYHNMEQFAIVSHYEDKLDFDKISPEKKGLIDVLRTKLSKRYFHELVLKSTHYRKGRITSGEFHAYLIKLAEARKMDLDPFKNLVFYKNYMLAYEQVDHEGLIKERVIIEEDIRMTLFEKTEQKILADLDKVLKKMDSFYQLEMTRDDLEFYNRKRELFSLSKFLSFIGTYAPRYDVPFDLPSNVVELDNCYGDFTDYYGCAKSRDAILNKNTLKRMEERKEKIAVQVCGGFHTDGMMKELKDKNISYVVLSPKITKEDQNNPYLDILLGRAEPLDELFTPNK